MRRALTLVAVIAAVSGCATNRTTATPEQISAARAVINQPPFVALLTMVNAESEFGEHSALVINGSQMVLYDPAGSFQEDRVGLVRAEDVLYGMNPALVDYYNSYHARFGYYVRMQRVDISSAEAEALIAGVQERGAVPQLVCGTAVSDILNDLPRFASIPNTFLPGLIMKRFGRLDGVQISEVREEDQGQNYR